MIRNPASSASRLKEEDCVGLNGVVDCDNDNDNGPDRQLRRQSAWTGLDWTGLDWIGLDWIANENAS
jgi:hypothetical protein